MLAVGNENCYLCIRMGESHIYITSGIFLYARNQPYEWRPFSICNSASRVQQTPHSIHSGVFDVFCAINDKNEILDDQQVYIREYFITVIILYSHKQHTLISNITSRSTKIMVYKK